MAEQFVDKVTVGIPSDLAMARSDVEAMRDEAASSAAAAETSATSAASSEARAMGAAEEARKLVDAQTGIHFSDTEPDLEDRTDGMAWLVADMANHKVTDLRRWDASSSGAALWPSSSTWPGSGTYPMPTGAWVQFTIKSSVIG